MKRRDHALAAPPERAPYFKVKARDEVWTLRTPSLHQVGKLAKLLTPEQGRELVLLAIGISASAKSPLTVVRALQEAGAEIVELLGALIGIAWKDPVYALDTPAPPDLSRPEQVRAYGAAVFEELYEEGWKLEQTMLLALALVKEISDASAFSKEVQEQIRFFLPTTEPKSADESSSSSSTSDDGEESPSTS